MDEVTEPPSPPAGPPSGEGAGRPRRPRGSIGGLPVRTVAICVCLALIGAIVAALVATVALDDDPTAPSASEAPEAALEPLGPIDSDHLLAVALRTPADQPATLEPSLDGRPLVVNLWAQNCAPCVEEMPLLDAVHRERDDIDLVGVDTDPSLDKAVAMARQTGITYPWFWDSEGQFIGTAKVAVMPTTLLLSPSGEVLATKTGAFDDRAELDAWLDDNVG